MRSIGRLTELPLLPTSEGQYVFKVELKELDGDWEEAFELPLWINIQSDNQPGATGT